jgi:hypothetical protein
MPVTVVKSLILLGRQGLGLLGNQHLLNSGNLGNPQNIPFAGVGAVRPVFANGFSVISALMSKMIKEWSSAPFCLRIAVKFELTIIRRSRFLDGHDSAIKLLLSIPAILGSHCLPTHARLPESPSRADMKQTPHKTHDSQEPDQPIRIGGTILGSRRHICAFFKSHDDHYGVLLPFIQDGFSSGEKAVHIVNPTRRDEHVQRLNAAGIDVAAGQKNGQLELLEWADVHLQDGTFDADRTRKLIAGIRRRAGDQGFRRVRFVTHMEWAVERHVGVDGLLEYEASANLVPSDDPVICAYELANFGGDVVVDIMRTHPMIIIGGILQENPFFVPPEEFLRERHGFDSAVPR